MRSIPISLLFAFSLSATSPAPAAAIKPKTWAINKLQQAKQTGKQLAEKVVSPKGQAAFAVGGIVSASILFGLMVLPALE